jgi:hypothetical protein
MRLLPPVIPLSHLCYPPMLPCVEVSSPKTINIKQYLKKHFSVKSRQAVIKLSETAQLYITKVIDKHFSCHHHIKKHFL